MISEAKIQEVHDILAAVVTNEIDMLIPEQTMAALWSVHDCLCWILEHECGDVFVRNMDRLKDRIKRSGYEMSRVQ